MVLQSANKIIWTYTDDDGTDYSVTATKAITDQGGGTPKVGGAAGSSADPPWPRGWRKRSVVCVDDLTGKARNVVAYTVTAPIWVTSGTTLTLNEGSDVATFTASKTHVGERKRRAGGGAS